MANTVTFSPHEFQQCTIDWVIKRLVTRSESDNPMRFLVADEVGLGKTIIARHTIKGLERNIPTKHRIIFYVCSSLDISRQNRPKLVDSDTTIIEADRINLLYSQGFKRTGTILIGLTPSTSMNFENSLGSMRERVAIVHLLKCKFSSIRTTRLCNLFKGQAKIENFLRATRNNQLHLPPNDVAEKIIANWEGIDFGKFKDLADFLKKVPVEDPSVYGAIASFRSKMAETIFSTLKPDLVILDEFQKFKNLIEISEDNILTHQISKFLFSDDTRVLLLSATPYTMFQPTTSQPYHQSTPPGLREVMRFLGGNHAKADEIVNRIATYGEKLRSCGPSDIASLVCEKKSLEGDVLSLMCRTERIRFESNANGNIRTNFLSVKSSSRSLSGANILEFLLLSQHVDSPRTLLSYWKSGNRALSYQKAYKIIEHAVGREATLETKAELYSALPDQDPHIKLDYVYRDALLDGRGCDALWIPPSKPYYPNRGVFAGVKDVKKALVFSSWQFVPRLVTAEIASKKAARHLSFKSNAASLLKGTPANWARFLFPSPTLIDCLSHYDFLEATDFSVLVELASRRLEGLLAQSGVSIDNQATGIDPWKLVKHLDFPGPSIDLKSLESIYSGSARIRRKGKSEIGTEPLSLDLINPLWNQHKFSVTNRDSVKLLAEIALTSPSICIIRAIKTIIGRQLTPEEWKLAMSFGFFDVKNFFSRDGHVAAIKSACGKEDSYPNQLAKYLGDGNFQATMDEYIFMISGSTTNGSVQEIIEVVQTALAPRNAKLQIPRSKTKNDHVLCDISACLGDADEESDTKETLRSSFNSPFWPFILSTTAVGQEGLDFHQYCKDIYHWNLPSSPVDFEQREGRINRFRNLAVRRSMVEAQRVQHIANYRTIWEAMFAESHFYCSRNDRYNLGLSPNWVYSCPSTTANLTMNRHILDIPASEDRHRYERLMSDLALYRLSLGQSDQTEYLKKLRGNTFMTAEVARAMMLSFFPQSELDFRKRSAEISLDDRKIKLLISDAKDYLLHIPATEELKRHVLDTCQLLEMHCASEMRDRNEEAVVSCIEKLYYFVHPHDGLYDLTPQKGFDDDIAKFLDNKAS